MTSNNKQHSSPATPATFNLQGLLDYQMEPSESLASVLIDSEKQVGVDLSDLGTGKTYIAGAALRHVLQHTKSRLFIVCPRVVKTTWKEVCEHFGIKPFGILNYEKLTRGSTPYVKWKRVRDPQGNLTDEHQFVWKLPKDTIIAFDEAHKAKGISTLNGQLLRAAKRQGYKIHCMSATMATNPMEMYSLGYVLGLHDGDFNNFREWCLSHNCKWTGRFKAMEFNVKEAKSQEAMKAIHREIFEVKKVGIRVKISDLGDRFPDSVISADLIDMGEQTAKINKVYETMQEELAKLEASSKDYSTHIFAILMKARRHAELLKIPTLVEMVKDGLDQGKSVVVFLNFTDSIDAMANRLKKFEISKIVGGQSDSQREVDIAKFQAGFTRICLVTISAGGAGVSLHDLTGQNERLALIAPTYSAIQMVQSLGRVRRQGGGFSRQQIVYADQTIETKICAKVRAKLKNINLLNDGDLDENCGKFKSQLRF